MDLPDIPDEDIELGWKPRSQVDIPQEMVVAIAQGMIDPDEVAARHGFVGAKWEKLKAWQPFQTAVATHRAELERSGYTFKVKAAFMAEDLLGDTYVKAKSPDATFAQKLQATQFFTRIAGLEPKEEKSVDPNSQVSININFGGRKVSASSTFDAESAEIVDATPARRGYTIAPLIDPTLFAEMAANGND